MNNFVRLSLSIQDIFSFYFLLHNFEKEKKGETRIVDPSTNQKGEKKKKKKNWLTVELGGEMNDATPAMKGPAAPNDNDLWPNRRDISINELQNASISHGLYTRLLWMWRTHEILKLRCFIQVSNSFNKAESNEEIDEPQRNKMQICNRSNSIEIEFKRRGALDGRD